MCRGAASNNRPPLRFCSTATINLPTIVEKTSSRPTFHQRTTTSTTMGSRKQAFLARSLAHRTVSFIEHEVEKMVASSPYLQCHEVRSDIAPLKREELQLGRLVGQGGFSEVHELESLEFLQEEEDEHDDADFFFAPEHPHATTSAQELRDRLADSCIQQGLVVKHLRQDLLPQRLRFQSAAADLVTEAQFLARLDHPHIIKLRGWTDSGITGLGNGEHDGYFLVMDRLDCTLAERIQEWKQEEAYNPQKKKAGTITHLQTKLRYAQELASALEYLHEQRLVFRDLKPENIGILNDSIVLFDFGLCRELPPESSNFNNNAAQYEMSGVGTLRYMAPEIFKDSIHCYNQKADTYSFSMVLYEMLFCNKPFELYSYDMLRMLVCDEHERPHIPSHCPPDIRQLLQVTWHYDPLERLDMKEIVTALHQTTAATTSSPKAASTSGWPRLQLLLETATRQGPLLLHKSLSFASATSERTNTTTLEESSIGSWFVSTP